MIPPRIYAIDPGLHATGWAVFNESGGLLCAALARVPAKFTGADAWSNMAALVSEEVNRFAGPLPGDTVVVELPQAYARGRSRADPRDLIHLAACAGAIAARLAPARVTTVSPAQWKGQTPKAVTEERVRARLSPSELLNVRLSTPRLDSNIWDAVGIGLDFIGLAKNRLT